MALIRQANAFQANREAVALDLADIAQQADAIKRDAQAQAEKIIEDAKAERERLIADAEQVGHKQGIDKGHKEGLELGTAKGEEDARRETTARVEDITNAWADALNAFQERREVLAESARTDLLRLAIAIAERITKSTIDANPDAAANQLEAALQLVLEPSTLHIETHPESAKSCTAALPDLTRAITDATTVTLTESTSVSPGSVVISTGAGSIDASINQQISSIADALLGAHTPKELNTAPSGESPNADPPITDHHTEPPTQRGADGDPNSTTRSNDGDTP